MSIPLWLLVAILFLCVLLSAFFSASEMAFSALNRVRVKMMEDEDPRAKLVLRLLTDDDRLLTTILIGNNLVNIAATAIATMLFTRALGDQGVTISTIVMTVILLAFGEIAPKSLAKAYPERFAMAVARPLRVLMTLFRPLDLVFSLLRSGISKLTAHAEDDSHIEDELMTMVDEAQSEGDMDAHEGELIRSAIEFGDQDALGILTPRVDITAIEDTATMDEAGSVFRESGYSRLPVYHEDMDHIVGILHEKDYYDRKSAGCNDIRQIMAPPVLAPATIKISKLLKLFQNRKTHLVILLDEFGGTEGLVTMEDVLEELVGEIYDEHDDINPAVQPLEDGSWSVDGAMRLEDLLEHFGIEDTYDAETVGGWAAEMIGAIPKQGDTFELPPIRCEVSQMDRRRVTRLRVVQAYTDPESKEEA